MTLDEALARIAALERLNAGLCSDHNALLADSARWQSRAEAAEARIAALEREVDPTDYWRNGQHPDRLCRTTRQPLKECQCERHKNFRWPVVHEDDHQTLLSKVIALDEAGE